jgi:hypothetical protein
MLPDLQAVQCLQEGDERLNNFSDIGLRPFRIVNTSIRTCDHFLGAAYQFLFSHFQCLRPETMVCNGHQQAEREHWRAALDRSLASLENEAQFHKCARMKDGDGILIGVTRLFWAKHTLMAFLLSRCSVCCDSGEKRLISRGLKAFQRYWSSR